MTPQKSLLFLCTFVSVFFFQSQLCGQSTTFASGSAIIDMGSASPTVKNSLKPYGLIYALLKNNHVPVSCVINSSKVKDGIDFVYSGKSYKGGTFIVSAEYISSDVTTVLNSWSNQGVVIDYTNSNLTVNVTYKINFVPKWVMDKTNGSIAVGFLNAAGIPSSAYAFKNPSQLDGCDDIFILPHADPSWNSHNNLYFWNKNNKGAIWAGCHAVSVMEGISQDTTISGVPTTLKMNFLSSTGLIPFTDHNAAATPFSNFLPSDAVAQFISKTDNAQLGGSETVYLPKLAGAWNAGAKILTSSPSQTDVPSLSPGAAVENIYGRAFDDATRGYVAYQASHNIGGTSSDQIAAQRIFFNFSLFALTDKVPPIITASLNGQPDQLRAGTTSGTLTANVTGTGTGFTYQWSSNVAGTFSNATSSTTTFTPSTSITSATTCILTCVVNESCGRVSFDAKSINIIPQTPPLVSAAISKSISDGCTTGSVSFNVFDSNVDANAGTRTLVTVTGLANGTVISTTSGDVTFTSTANYKGTTTGTYTISNGIATSTGNISITVGTATLAPSIANDAVTAIANSLTVINVLGNDKNDASAADGGQLYIRDIPVKPTKGYVYINSDGTVSYLSQNTPVISGGDSFQYLACNNAGYCSSGTVTVTLVDNCGTGKYQLNQTLTTLNATLTASADTYLDRTAISTPNGNTDPLLLNATSATVQQRPIITFATLSSVLSNTALVNKATLILTTATAYSNGTTTTTAPFAANINALLKPWTESTATWLTTDGSIAWSSSGAGGSGSDFTTTGASTFPFVVSTNKLVGDTIIADVKTIVQNWVTTSSTNYGLLINRTPQTKPTPVSFYSKENASSSKWPQLSIDYYPCLTRPTSYLPVVYPDATSTTSALSVTFNPLSNDVNYYSNTNSLFAVTTPAHGTATISGNQIIYTPDGTFVGIDTLTYTVKDLTNLTTNKSTVRVTVSRVAPSILNDVATTNSNAAITIAVSANDVDPQSPGTLSAPVIVTAPTNGTAAVSGNNIVYTPSSNFTGTDNFTYKRTGAASDACSTALSGTATVTVTVNNQTPTANPVAVSTFACAPVTINLKSNGSDPEGGSLTVNIVSTTTHGTLTATGAGIYKYTPTSNYTGTDQFTYTVTDPLNATSTAATGTITVSGSANPNTAPIAVNDADNTLTNQLLYTNVLANDSDPNNDPLSISITAAGLLAPSNGTVQLMPNNLIKYTPTTGFSGTDTYQYKLTDSHPDCGAGGSLSAIALVTITVTAVPTTLSGTVYNDVDASGQSDFTNIKTNSEVGTNGNGSVYIYLVDNSNIIKDRTPVDVNGTYTLSNVPSLTSNLKLILSSEDLAIGTTLSVASLPTGYVNSSPLTRTLPTTTLADMGPYNWGIFSNPVLTPGTIVAPGNLCGTSGTPGNFTTTANATGGSITATGYNYQWQSSSVSDFSSGVTTISGATLTTYTPSGAITQTTYFRRKASTNNDAAVYSNIVSVVLNANPTVAISPTTSTLNLNANISLTASGAGTYSWSPSTGLSATNTATVTAGPLTTTSYTVTGTITATGCVNTATVTITVIDPGVIGSSESNCGTYTPTGFISSSDASGASPITYQWQSSTVSDFSSGVTTISGATSSTYSPTSISATTYYRRVATYSGSSFNSNIITATVKAIPSVTAGSNSPVCVGGSVTFTSTAGASSYSWTGPNSFSSTSQNPSISVSTTAASGTYTVTVTGANGCTNTATTSVTVNALSTVSVSPVSATIQSGTNTILTASGADTYSWSPSTGLSATNTATVTAGSLTTTSYTVTGTITATGCVNTATVTVTVIDPGVIGSTQSNCGAYTPTGLTSSSAASGASPITYQWQSSTVSDFSSAVTTISGATSSTYSPTSISATTYYRRVATYSGSSFNSNIITATVKAIPSVTAGSNSPVCAGGSVTFTSTAGASSYSWTGPNSFSSTSQNPSISVSTTAASGTYTVTVTGANGCTNTATTNVTVNALPTVSISPVSATIQSGTNTILTASGADTYSWSPSTGLSSTNTATVTAGPLTTTSYTVTGTITATGCVNTATVTVTVIDPGVIGANQSSCGSFTPSALTSTSDASGASPITYQWQSSTVSDFSSGITTISGATSSTYSPTSISSTTYYRRVATYSGSSFNSNIITATVKAIPSVTAGSNSPVCAGGSVTFTSTAGASSYSWTGPNSFSSTSQNPSISVSTTAASGTYTVTVTGANGCTNTATTTATVNALPTVSVTPSSATIQSGSSQVLTAGGALTYSWSPSTNLSATNTATVTAGSLTTTTAYIVTGTATTTGCVNTATVTVTVIDPGVIGSSQSNCGTFTPTGLTSTSAASGASPITYQWQSSTVSDFSSGVTTISGATSSTYSPTSVSVTTYYRRVATYSGKSFSSNIITATVKAIPSVTAGSNSPVCAGGSVTFTSTAGASSYSWTGPNSFSSISQNPSISVAATAASGTYTVTVTAANGCTNSATTTVTVNALPTVTVSPASASILAGGNQVLTAAGALTYSWSPSTNLSATNTATVTAGPLSTTTYTVTGTASATGCINTAKVIVTVVVNSSPLSPGTIGTDQTICVGSTPAALTSITIASGGTGVINYQWQTSTDNVNFTDIAGATSAIYTPPSLSQKTYYRRAASTSSNAAVYSNIVTITTLTPPVITGITGPCAIPKDSTRTYSVAAAIPAATNYVWTLPGGWSGNSTTNSINIKPSLSNGTISVVPYNGTCIGNTVTYQVSVIDYTNVTITGTPVTASGNNNNPITVTVQLIDVNGNPISCSGGVATLCSNSGTFGPVVDNNDGTYTALLTSSANDVIICGTVGGIPVSKTTKVTFTGPQGYITGHVPILSTETPTITFTATAGRAPFTVIYHSAKSNKNDTLINYTSGVPAAVALIPSTTLYTLVSVIDANGERRDNNFIRDTATIIVVSPKVIITLHADPAIPDKDSTWITKLTVKTKNIGDLDLTSSQAKLNLKDVFPSPVTFVLDSVLFNGNTIVPNRGYDGIQSADLFARLNDRNNKVPVAVTTAEDPQGMAVTTEPVIGVDGASDNLSRAGLEIWTNSNSPDKTETKELTEVTDDGHSIYLFGPLSNLPVGAEADIILWLHVKPNGYTQPFVMQAVALGTGSTQGATALATSLSNDNNDINQHPEITKVGDPVPAVVNLFPTAVIGASLSAGTPVLQGNGTYNVLLSARLKNYGNLNLETVQLFLNLSRMIGAPSTFSVAGPIITTGNLIANPSYDGILDSNILSPNTIIGYKDEGLVQFTINIAPNQLSSLYRLQARATGFSYDLNKTVTDLSTDGTNPDPDGNNIPDEKVITIIAINLPIPPLVPGTIGILVDPVTGTTVSSKAYCNSASGVVVVSNSATTGGSGPYQYQWQSSTDNNVFTNISNATDSIYTTGTVLVNIYLRRMVISDNQVGYTNSVYIRINPVSKPVISVIGSLVLPQNGTDTLTSTAASSYAWSNGATVRSIVVTVGTVGSYQITETDANGCIAVSDAITVTPPPPTTVNATYIIGAISNPANSGIQVTGFPGAKLNYYILSTGGTLIPVPVLPGAVGLYTYYVSQTINGIESARVPYTVTMLDPAKVADLQKLLSKAPVLQSDGSFLMGFSILASNLRAELLDSVKIKDDLSKVFPSSTQYQVLQLQASGKLKPNETYNGNTQIDMLADGSQLPGLQTDSVQVMLKVFPNGFEGQLNNTAIQTAKSPYGTFNITSNDPKAGNGFTVRNPTKFFIPFVDIFIPSGFSPNHDGVNDLFVITRPFNTAISLEIFNRWGNAVYKAADYKNEWDGRGNQPNNILGDELPDGTYYYIVTASDRTTGLIRKFAGFLTLKR